MAYQREPEFPLLEIDKKVRSLIKRLHTLSTSLSVDLPPTVTARGKLKIARNHVKLARRGMIAAYLKGFHKNYYEKGKSLTPKVRGFDGLVKYLDDNVRSYQPLIKEIETIHLQMGEQGCNFWSFIALERAVMELQFAFQEIKELKELVWEEEVDRHVHSSTKRSTGKGRVQGAR